MERGVLILLPSRGFPGGALLSFVERLVEHGVTALVAAREAGPCEGTGGVKITAHRGFDDPGLLDGVGAVVVFDDGDGALSRTASVQRLVRDAYGRGGLVCAVGEGIETLAAAGLVRGREVAATRATSAGLANAGALPVVGLPRVASGRLLTATEAGAPVLADDLDSFRGVGPERPAPAP